MQKIEIGCKYRHFKGNLYEIVGFAKHSETMENMIIYKSLRNNSIWVRPYSMWSEVVDGKGTLRFSLIED